LRKVNGRRPKNTQRHVLTCIDAVISQVKIHEPAIMGGDAACWRVRIIGK
jgi:hypothetical protein